MNNNNHTGKNRKSMILENNEKVNFL